MPAAEDLLAWSGSGTMPGRTWVVNPSPDVLRRRWKRLITAPPGERSELLVEHKRDRRIDTLLSDNLPGYPSVGALASDTGSCPEPVRYGYRTLDRSWIVPDKRVINQPNPSLWQVRAAPGQLFLTAPDREAPTGGPATSFTSMVPDLHHYHGRGGRAYPLWLDAAGKSPNLVAGLLDHLAAVYERTVSGPDMFAYFAAVTAHPAYVERYRDDLHTPGLRIPLTADAECFDRAVLLGRRILWLHTYGERFVDPGDGRPPGPPRVVGETRPLVVVAIPDCEGGMPADIGYDEAAQTLQIGGGRISGVSPAMWEYETSGYKLIRRWFSKRKREPEGRRSSPLEDIVAKTWDPRLDKRADRSPPRDRAAGRAGAGAEKFAQRGRLLITVADLSASGVFPVMDRPTAEKPPRQEQL